MARHPRHRRGDRDPGRGRLHRRPRRRGPVARRRGPPSPTSPPRRRGRATKSRSGRAGRPRSRRRGGGRTGGVRQRPPDASRHHQRVLGPLLHRGPLRPARHPPPGRTKHGSRPCSATSKPNGPTSRRSPPQHATSRTRHRPTRLQHPPPARLPRLRHPRRRTPRPHEATPSARPAKTASTGPASPASPTIATTTRTSHEHTPPALRKQTPENGHLLRSTSVARRGGGVRGARSGGCGRASRRCRRSR